ncbi:MAG: DUF2817 domain-containing protein [Gemmatimonadota bacterium]|nr:DUF2817 domain-containing protein [Gemmatimonadota bacterium]
MTRTIVCAAMATVLSSTPGPLQAQLPTESVVGTSEAGRPIRALEWNERDEPTILIFGGIHGDERSAGEVAMRLERRWRSDPSALDDAHVVLVPIVNPDGWERSTRKNANGVDLNRNFPDGWVESDSSSSTHGGREPLSEAEARLLFELVERLEPAAIMSIHSCRSCGGVNNYDGPAGALAETMTEVNGYRPTAVWEAPTPGSFGTFAGKTRGIPTITLEIPREVSGAEELESNVRAVEAFVREAVRSGAGAR